MGRALEMHRALSGNPAFRKTLVKTMSHAKAPRRHEPPAGSLFPGGPEGKAALMLFFDDGLPSHLDRVMPALKSRGLTADFYVCPGSESYRERQAEWEDAVVRAEFGFGNHTWTHRGGRTAEQVAEEIERCTVYLRRLLGDVPLSYASPGGLRPDRWPMPPDRLADTLRRQRLFPRPRAPRRCAGLNLKTRESIFAHLDAVAASGGGDILTFHGVEEGPLAIPMSWFEEICDYLADHRDRIEVITHTAGLADGAAR